MKIRPVGSELSHTDIRTDGYMTKLIAAFRNFANAPKNSCHDMVSAFAVARTVRVNSLGSLYRTVECDLYVWELKIKNPKCVCIFFKTYPLSQYHFFHHKSRRIGLGSNLGLCGWRPATSCLKPQHQLYLKTQSLPRNKDTFSVIKTNQSVLYKEIIAVCSEIHTKHINKLCGQNVECRTYRAVNTAPLGYNNQSVNAV